MKKEKNARILSQGAEATLTKTRLFGEWVVEKTRTPKSYRHAELDARIRKERTAREARMIHEVKEKGIPAPLLYAVDSGACRMVIEYIEGPRLKNVLLAEKSSMRRKEILCAEFGRIIARLHTHGIIHGDLTTSNILVRRNGKKEELVLIDFGLSSHSTKLEDAAVDMVNLKKTLTATHADYPKGWESVTHSYIASGGKKTVLAQMEEVEKRIRYA
ncbi:MAG: KEOPS complex kinase/ATPase Bud32 [archaeon]